MASQMVRCVVLLQSYHRVWYRFGRYVTRPESRFHRNSNKWTAYGQTFGAIGASRLLGHFRFFFFGFKCVFFFCHLRFFGIFIFIVWLHLAKWNRPIKCLKYLTCCSWKTTRNHYFKAEGDIFVVSGEIICMVNFSYSQLFFLMDNIVIIFVISATRTIKTAPDAIFSVCENY